jgi:hypothetical protein
MYVTRDKSQAVVFAFSVNSDHWSSLVPRFAALYYSFPCRDSGHVCRLMLQGLLPDAIYEIYEPLPSHLTQSTGSYRIVESVGLIFYSSMVAFT